MSATVAAVSRRAGHHFSKHIALSIHLTAGLGVDGDGHRGAAVKHRWLARKDPRQPNLRQVHLIGAELFDELRIAGFTVGPGELGENVATRGIDLPALPQGTRLRLGAAAVVEITGLRDPCVLLDRFQPGLLAATRSRDADGRTIRKAGVMSIVLESGEVFPGDPIAVTLPAAPHRGLEAV
jgi:MOSC domain-containing protein YiiM